MDSEEIPYHPSQHISITDLTVNIPFTSRTTSVPKQNNPSRWNTLEFKFYYVVLFCALPLMIWIPTTVSNPSHPNYVIYEAKLWSGWMLGRKLDISDNQYRAFRNNLPVLTGVTLIYLSLKQVWVKLYCWSKAPPNSLHLIPFNIIISILFLLGLHGIGTFKVVAILSANYTIAKMCKSSRLGPVLSWAFNIGILFMNEQYNGYRFGEIIPALGFLDEEKYEGFYPRWHISFNITMLRLVSFNMDYFWACRKTGPSGVDRDYVE
jgi:D-alanyl-lipoteichoic acid acyltransferase DltB (MBOAT superfamily)